MRDVPAAPDVSLANRGPFLTKGESIADWLRSEILEGRFAPGTPLRQDHIAELLDTSSTPVREAFGVLQAEGFVERRSHRGVVVAKRSLDDVRDAYEIRMALEALAVRRLIEQPDQAVMDAALEALKRADKALSAGDGAAFRRANDDFHMSLVRGGRSRQLLEIMQLIFPRSKRMYASLSDDLMAQMHVEHRQIIEAIMRGDVTGVVDLVMRHRPEAPSTST